VQSVCIFEQANNFLPLRVLVCFISPRVKEVRNEASSCPVTSNDAIFHLLTIWHEISHLPELPLALWLSYHQFLAWYHPLKATLWATNRHTGLLAACDWWRSDCKLCRPSQFSWLWISGTEIVYSLIDVWLELARAGTDIRQETHWNMPKNVKKTNRICKNHRF